MATMYEPQPLGILTDRRVLSSPMTLVGMEKKEANVDDSIRCVALPCSWDETDSPSPTLPYCLL